MSEVKRFTHEPDYCGPGCGHVETPDGDWVIAADFDTLAAENQRLQAELDDPDFPPKYARRLIAQLRAELHALKGEQVAVAVLHSRSHIDLPPVVEWLVPPISIETGTKLFTHPAPQQPGQDVAE